MGAVANDDVYRAMLAIIIPPIIDQIVKNSNIDEQSKLWHYSPLTLYTMYQDELLTGSYDYPEEA